MNLNHRYNLIAYLILAIFCSCSTSEKEGLLQEETPLFRKVTPQMSGVHFKNSIEERFEYFDNFSYVYNGGGTAIGDINNDGLQDIFFTGNEINNRLYLNKGNFKFEDVSEKSQITGQGGWNNGVAMVDINGDGFLDIYICRGGWNDRPIERKNLLFVNQQDNTFKEMASHYGLADSGYSTQASFFDFDNDGDLDVYLVNRPSEFMLPISEVLKNKENPRDEHRDKLYQNNNGIFTDVSAKMGITHNFGYGLGIVTADINKDGYTDIYVANDFDEHDYYYVNQAGKQFTESIKSATHHIPLYAMGVDVMDINNDGLEDIFVTEMLPSDRKRAKVSMPSMDVEGFNALLDVGFYYQYMHNMLQLNQGNNQFSEVGQFAGIDKTDWSWAGLAADFDNDGHKDLLVTNGYKRDIFDNDVGLRIQQFFRANKAKYRSARELIAAKSDEIINLYKPIKEQNYLFQNQGDVTFKNVSEAWGFREQSFSNGASIGDLDNDGDLDIVINNLEEEAFIYENTSTKVNHFLRINLKGPKNNPFGIGAKITIRQGKEIQYQEFKMVRGYLSSQEPIIHFGLGQKQKIDSITISWPGGKQQILENVEPNQTLPLQFSKAILPKSAKENKQETLFTTQTDNLDLHFSHKENEYDDFALEVLLPHKYSQFGPAIAVADVNNDGKVDIYIGGAKGQSGVMYIQTNNGRFKSIKGPWETYRASEEIAAVFFDANADGKQDLYIVNGGNEFAPNHPLLKDNLFINQGNTTFKDNSTKLPNNAFSGAVVKANDFDEDGDTDLFVGGRLTSQNYPMPASGYLYENQNGQFVDVTRKIAPELNQLGLITDAAWVDYDADNDLDLIVVGEWMPITIFNNTGANFEKKSPPDIGLADTEGWWYTIDGADFDKDGDIDLIAGNLGLNYKYKASVESPFEVYSADFDHNGRSDIILGLNEAGKTYPLRGKECSSEQMPSLHKKFPTYTDFSMATVEDMVGKKGLASALHLQAKTFASIYLENNGDGTFKTKPLPALAQFSSVNDLVIDDFNGDGNLDAILGGNLHVSEIETPRNDASYGVLLTGNGKGQFLPHYPYQSGLYMDGDVKQMRIINIGETRLLVVAKNNEALQLVKLNQ